MSSPRDPHRQLTGTTPLPGRSVPPHQDCKGHLPPATRTTSSNRPPLKQSPLGISVPPHCVNSIPSPGRQGRLTGVAGASLIWPDRSIPPPRKSSAPGATNVACGARSGQRSETNPVSNTAGRSATATSSRRLVGLFLFSQIGPVVAAACRELCRPLPGGARTAAREAGAAPEALGCKGGGPSQSL